MEKLKVTNAADSAAIYIYSDIGEYFGGISANDMRLAMESIKEKSPIEVHIDTPGGDYFTGINIYGQLKQWGGKVTSVVDGRAASAGSLVMLAGSKVKIAASAWVMIHEVQSGGHGTAEDFRKEADRIEAMTNQIVSIYMTRWQGTEKELRDSLKAETWFTAEEALAAGLVDEVIDTMAAAAYVDAKKFGYRNVPEALLKAAEPDKSQFPKLMAAEQVVNELFNEKEPEKTEEEEPCDAK
jgi:ATP-dependent Clp endopeptidase proteolytic subunit ClpP